MDFSLLGRMFLSLPIDDIDDAQLSALTDSVATYFRPNERLKYRGVAGVGRHGGALVFTEVDENSFPKRRIVVKYSHNPGADADLRNEAFWLEQLRGAEHIAQMIPLANTELNVSGTGRRPTIALEFIENGTIGQFRARYARDHGRIPCRLLWRVFYCFARQVAAMAFPLHQDPDLPVVRETWREDIAPFALTQNSGHDANFMMGELGDGEHNLVPRIQLIDFGRGRQERDFLTAYAINICNAAFMLLVLALPQVPVQQLRTGESHPYGCDWGGETFYFQTMAHPAFLTRQDIDAPLKVIIARCMSSYINDLPPLSDVLHFCEVALETRTADNIGGGSLFPPHRESETDDGIRAIIKKYVLDAPTAGGELLPDRPIYDDSQIGYTLLGRNLYNFLPRRSRNEPAPAPAPGTLWEGYQGWLAQERADPDPMDVD
ncbi:hypothetical protein F4781DRAFT_87507 [Annulohypoxylon bovei var. microspora]|nr:hypothetical protein F4781DRAFT_87507 [Annulohypoxylon bovei var. microspora]